ncbi:MAG: thiaminase II [Acidobacteria bacterium]|nr:MAG: thiaminase II [Acidobacteriota bacterium]
MTVHHRSSPRTFTDHLWQSITDIFDAILAHPFISGLTDGSLDRASFQFYVIQDALYLREFARALSLLAAKAPLEEHIIMFTEHASGALKVERALHESFFRDLGLTEEAVRATPMAPTNLAYTSYLLAVAYSRPIHEVIAALLPCYWIYWEVGKRLLAEGSSDPLYQRWIDTYGAEDFGQLVEAVLEVTNQWAEPLDESARRAMERHFLTTSRYEWMFWEMGYRRETWPV